MHKSCGTHRQRRIVKIDARGFCKFFPSLCRHIERFCKIKFRCCWPLQFDGFVSRGECVSVSCDAFLKHHTSKGFANEKCVSQVASLCATHLRACALFAK